MLKLFFSSSSPTFLIPFHISNFSSSLPPLVPFHISQTLFFLPSTSLVPTMNPPRRRRRRLLQASTKRRKSGLSYKSLLTFMLSVVGVALQTPYPIIPRSPTSGTPERRPPPAAADHRSIVVAYSLLFSFSASLISVALSAHDKYRRASRLLQLLGFDSILLALASLLSTILPPKLWLLPYILFAVFLVCSCWGPLKWLYLRGREGAFSFCIRRFTLAHETPPPLGLENV